VRVDGLSKNCRCEQRRVTKYVVPGRICLGAVTPRYRPVGVGVARVPAAVIPGSGFGFGFRRGFRRTADSGAVPPGGLSVPGGQCQQAATRGSSLGREMKPILSGTAHALH